MSAVSEEPTGGRRLSDQARRMQPNAIRALAGLITRPGIVSFAGGVPSPATFPAAEIAEIAARLIQEQGERVLQYGTTRGNARLTEIVSERLVGRGIEWAAPESLLLTSGSQQGLDLLARVLIDPGDVVIVELPSYIGGLASLRAAGADLVGIRLTTDGPDLDELRRTTNELRGSGRQVKAIYTIPTFQNPSGITASQASREALHSLAYELDLVVIEDDPYSEIHFDSSAPPPPPIASIDDGTQVVYLGSLSKVLCPGLRTAWIAASPTLARHLELAKEAADLCSSSLDQAIAATALDEGLVDDRLPRIRDFYSVRCHAMLEALERTARDTLEWTRPDGGLFIWVTLPEEIDARSRLDDAVANGVAYVPGAPFFVDGSGSNTLRLAFSKEEPEAIGRGIATLVATLTS